MVLSKFGFLLQFEPWLFCDRRRTVVGGIIYSAEWSTSSINPDNGDNDNGDDNDNVHLRVDPCDRCHTCGKSTDSLAQISVGKTFPLPLKN